MEQKNKSGKRYDRQFKEDAVRHLISSGESVSEIARNLGTTPYSLNRWKAKYLEEADKAGAGAGRKPSEVDAENRSLRKELARVTEEREILKKALVFFGQESQRDSRS